MNITVIGAGYVGLVAAACFAKSGHQVIGVDIDRKKIESLKKGKCYFFEPGLDEILESTLSAGLLFFTTDTESAIKNSRVIFIAAGTPPMPNGNADLSAVMAAVKDVARFATQPKTIVIKSTVPTGTAAQARQLLQRLTKLRMDIVSNPEFLRQGSAVYNFIHPDRVVIGSGSQAAIKLVKSLYSTFVPDDKIFVMSNESAEMVKYASNAFLAMKISFINEIAEICSSAGVDVKDITKGMAADSRIGSEFLKPGIGYGGSCFPKDVRMLIYLSRKLGVKPDILDSVHRRNKKQKKLLAQAVLSRFGSDLRNNLLGVWGLSFKPQTDDIREAPALDIIRMLSKAGANIKCYDPVAEGKAKAELSHMPGVKFCDKQYDVIERADALIICTEWEEFINPDFHRIARELRQPVIFDGRGLYDAQTLSSLGLEYYTIGKNVPEAQKLERTRRAA